MVIINNGTTNLYKYVNQFLSIDISEDISFIDDDEISDDDNGINVEINEDDKN